MNRIASSNRTVRHPLAAALAAVALVLTVSQSVHAGKVTPPDVPFNLRPQDGSHAFLVGHAYGTQNYVCAASTTSGTGVAYSLFTPEATLFNADGDEIITHFFSPNPDPSDPNTSSAVIADGAIRPTWQHSRDGSSVWAKMHPNGSLTKDGAIAWLLLDVVGKEEGLTGGDILFKTSQIQRLNTTGGIAPRDGCDSLADAGHQAFVPYTADYYFYTME